MIGWGQEHIVRVAGETGYPDPPSETAELHAWTETHRKKIEPWLSAVFQGEHLSLLLGSGFTTAVASEVGARAASMGTVNFDCPHEEKLNAYVVRKAAEMGRGSRSSRSAAM